MKINRNNIKQCAVTLLLSALPAMAAQAQQVETSDSLVNVAFGTLASEDVITAIQQVNMERLLEKDYTNDALTGALNSYIGGYNGSLWGQAPLVLVDGMPRNYYDLLASEVQSVTVLKDAAAAALYGSRGAKGVVLITTKRGYNKPMQIDFRANVGFYVPKSYPKYLDGASYMTLYNEACRNDGISERYDANTIYQTANGQNPWRYPNQRYYNSDNLRKFSNSYQAVGEIRGGNERTHYYLNLGLGYDDGLVKVGDHKNDNTTRFNVRGNVDFTITDWLKGFTNASVLVNDNYASRGDFWSMASGTWPNRFGVLIPVELVDHNNQDLVNMLNSATIIDGHYLLGGTSSNTGNAIADSYEAGYVKTKTRNFTFDVGLDFDLKALTPGLRFKTVYSLDYRSIYSEGYSEGYAVYEPVWANVNGTDMVVDLTKYGNDTNSTNEYVGQSTYSQNMMYRAQFDYERTFNGLHNVNARLVGWGYSQHNSADSGHSGSSYHNTTNANLGLQIAYNYDQRYYATLTGAMVHSSKLAEGHRNAFSPSVALGWRLGQEKFIKENAQWINDLKITASVSRLNQDIDINDYYMYKGYYGYKNSGGGWYTWRDGLAGGYTTIPKRIDNLDLTYIKREEFRVGIDGRLFDNILSINADYFIQDTKGGLTQGTNSIFPSFMNKWDSSFVPYINYNNDRRHGFDFSLGANKKFGEWDLSANFSGMIYNDKATRRDEMVQEAYQSAIGRPLSSSYGLICEGFFTSQAEIDAAPRQTFGGTLKPGDLKYKDVNEDGVIDNNDRVYLGRWTPKFTYGINISAKWRNFTLYAYGTGQSGAIGYKNSSYYLNGGDNKYSENAWLRWTPETAETALYPRLTTGTTANNSQNSTFWMYKSNSFNLSSVQLTYDLPSNLFNNKALRGVSVYAQGANLATISKERKHLEMSTYSPQTRYYLIGCKLTF